jgi:hypothetical protein
MTVNDSTLLIFKAITSFIHDLNEIYGEQQKPLLLYDHLIEKTGIIHEEPIKKHIYVFKDFVTKNEDGILSKNIDKINEKMIKYSDKVYIDVYDILEKKDENQDCIWQHLLTLLALLNPSGQAKNLLKKEKETKGQEEDFLASLIDKVGQHIDPTASNPMENMTSLMSSGVFTDLMSSMDQGIGNGSLDMHKLVGSLQTMIGSLSTMIDTENIPNLNLSNLKK